MTVRGVFYYGRQECTEKCAAGLWPSFINIEGGTNASWAAMARTEEQVEADAKKTGKRFEIWVTVVGHLRTRAKHSSLGPSARSRWGVDYGHLNAFPAQISVESFRDIEVKINPQSLHD